MSNFNNDSFFPVMENMTVKSVRSYLTHKQSIIIPLGVIEQHGCHLPLCTDALIARNMAKKIGLMTDTLVAPVMYQSFSGGDCPGTINISPATMSLVVSDMLVSLASQGFRKFYLLLCHGGSENASALDNALKILLRTNPVFEKAVVALMPIWKLNSKGIGWAVASHDGDWHAGWIETSMVLAFEPDKVRMNEIELDSKDIVSLMRKHPDNYQKAEKMIDNEFVVARFRQKEDVKVGVMGDPARSSAELGRQIIEDASSNAAKLIRKFENEFDGHYREVEFVPQPLMLEGYFREF